MSFETQTKSLFNFLLVTHFLDILKYVFCNSHLSHYQLNLKNSSYLEDSTENRIINLQVISENFSLLTNNT